MRRLPPVAALLLALLAHPAAATPGALDGSFSGDGIQPMFTGGATAQAVAIDAQDRIVLVGYTFGKRTDVAVARVRPNGGADSSLVAKGASGSTSARKIRRSMSRSTRTGRSSSSASAPIAGARGGSSSASSREERGIARSAAMAWS